MGIYDKVQPDTVITIAAPSGNRCETFALQALPASLAELQACPEAALATPFQTAALTVLALCAYASDRKVGQKMLNWLRPICRSLTLQAPQQTIIIRLPCPIPFGWKATMFPVMSRVI